MGIYIMGRARVKGETHCAMRRLSMSFDGLKNVDFIE